MCAANVFSVTPSPATPANDLIGRTVAGYQAWFHASDTEDGWFHWIEHHGRPAVGNVHVEMFPDLSEYPAASLHRSALPDYPNGQPVGFYDGHDPAAIDVHFRWMKEYGIDGVGVQRFYSNTSVEEVPEPCHLSAIRQSAEKYGRLFYIMYDTSGCGRFPDELVDRFKADVLHNVEDKHLICSPMYAHAHGKPVICVWGLAVAPNEPGRYPAAPQALEFINWLKERGYFVIGGLPDNEWDRDESDYKEVYAALDMISPWTPGRFNKHNLAAWIDEHLPRDLAYCRAHGQEYQPVLFAGFSWSNFMQHGPANEIPRDAGRFLWEQAKRYAKEGIRGIYFAMFDEYDEGTAIAKAATDSSMLHTGEQYNQLLCADGWWLSSDFYLRLGGAIARTLRGEQPLTEEVPVPHSEGPVYWRNGFEKRVTRNAAQVEQPVDICVPHGEWLCRPEVAEAAVVKGEAGDTCFTGCYAFRFVARGAARYRLALADIPVKAGLTLRYRLRAAGTVGVDLLFDDGSRLSEALPLPTAQDAGWTAVAQALPAALAGRRIIAIEVAGHGTFDAYIDDVEISL